MDVLSWSSCLKYAVLALLLAGLFWTCARKLPPVLQQCGFKSIRMLRLYGRKDNMLFQRYFLLALALILTSGLLGISFLFLGPKLASAISLLPFVFFCLLFWWIDRKYALRVPLQEQRRQFRLEIVFFFLLAVVLYFAIVLLNVLDYVIAKELFTAWKYVVLSLMPFLLPLLAAAANGILSGCENIWTKRHVMHAQAKLKEEMAVSIVIAGNCGTAVIKSALCAMLSEKYAVCCVNDGENKLDGTAEFVEKLQTKSLQFFIAEADGKYTGETAALCSMLHPQYAILAEACPAGLEGITDDPLTVRNEVFDCMGEEGLVVAFADDLASMPKDHACRVRNLDHDAVKNVVCGREDVSFMLELCGESISIHSKALGAFSAKYIAAAAAMALELGVSAEQICAAVEGMDRVPHCMEVFERENITVLDFGACAHLHDAALAMEFLAGFQGRKIVVTPGMVELGVLEEGTNKAFGKIIAGADSLILIGDTLAGVIRDAALEAGLSKDSISVVPTYRKAGAAVHACAQGDDVFLLLRVTVDDLGL